MMTPLTLITILTKVAGRQPATHPRVSSVLATTLFTAVGVCVGIYINNRINTYYRLRDTVSVAQEVVDNDMEDNADGLPTEELEYPEVEQDVKPEFSGRGCGADIDNTRYTTRSVRKIRRGRRLHYVAKMVASAKLKFGTPVRTEANLLVVRRYLVAATKAQGLRDTHARDAVTVAIELVFVYDRVELEMRELSPYLQVRGYGYWHWILSKLGLTVNLSGSNRFFGNNQ